MPAVVTLPSKGEINRCGDYLAWIMHGVAPHEKYTIEQERIDHAVAVVSTFRAAHQYPLTKVAMGVRSMVATEGADIVVSQRLKRLPRILRKLHRMTDTNLARLEDVGGCRAVLADGDEITRVHRRLRKRWGDNIVRTRDYIEGPKDIGYRALHVVVERDGRRIEVQLRTQGQQAWAEAVETADARLGMNLKDGEGPDEMVRYFTSAGVVIHAREYKIGVTPAAMEEFAEARQAVIQAGYYRA